jgi:RHS repeat-associated protein
MTDVHAELPKTTSLSWAAGRVVRRMFALRAAFFVLFAILLFGGVRALGQGLDPAPPQELQPESTDSTDVSSSGVFSYSRPISIPVARGPAPHLALSYSSSSGNGIAGYGWLLTGLPAIVRIRGDTGMNFAGSDAYAYLPGGWGTSAAADNILINPKLDNNWYLRRNTSSPIPQFRSSTVQTQDGPLYWTMRDGKGMTYYFGGDESSIAPGGNTAGNSSNSALWEPNNGVTESRGIIAWALYKVVDADGNFYRVIYHRTPRTLYPSHIQYNLPYADPQRSLIIRFSYESRADVVPAPQSLAMRLKALRVYAGVSRDFPPGSFNAVVPSPGAVADMTGAYSLVREYVMDYSPSVTPGDGTALGVSLLTMIEQYGTDGDSGGGSLEPTTFTYTDADASTRGLAGFPLAMSVTSSSFMQLAGCDPTQDNAACKWQTFIGDVDGDGRADIVRAYYGQFGGYVQYTCGANDGFTGPVITHSNYPSNSNQPQYLITMGDINGDGKQDLVAVFPDPSTHTITTYIAFGGANCSLGSWQSLPQDSLPLGLKMSFYNPSPSPNDYPPSRLPPNGNWHLRSWRILAADINGDGLADIILFDNGSREIEQCGPEAAFFAPMSTRVLYHKLSTGMSLGPVRFSVAANFGAASGTPRWMTTEDPRSFFAFTIDAPTPPCVLRVDYQFNGIIAADVNGDGRTDIVASWSSEYPISGDPPPPPAFRLFMTALGGDDGLRTPLESGWIDNVPLAGVPGFHYWPYMSLRVGDINGDGLKDVLFSFQGEASKTGYGRYLQSWLGSTSASAWGLTTTGSTQTLFLDAQDTSTYPYAAFYRDTAAPYNNQPHMNNWDFFVSDVNGDGIDDFVEVYRGAGGSRIGWALGTPNGMANFTINDHPNGSTTRPLDDGPIVVPGQTTWDTNYRRWASVVGDLNGDAMSDLVLARVGGSSSSQISFIPGTNAGLAPDTPINITASPIVRSGDSRFVSMRLADITGSGREEIIIINDNAEQADSTQIEFSIRRGAPSDGGIPNLLKTINNGVGGTTTVTYGLPRDFRNAIRPASTNVCIGADGRVVVGPECGKPNALPRPLVARIDRDNGQGPAQLRSFTYDYFNGRTLAGPPPQRADLGFEFITKTDIQLGVSGRSNYLQVKPYQRLVKNVGTADVNGIPLSNRSLTYCCSDAPQAAQLNFVGVATDASTTFEQGTEITSRQTSYTWRATDPALPVDVKLWEARNSTTASIIPNARGESDWDVVTDYYYDPDDLVNWYVGKVNGILRFRDNTISDRVVLEATRISYDASHRLRPTLSQKLLLPSPLQNNALSRFVIVPLAHGALIPLQDVPLSCRSFGAQPGGILDDCSDRVDGTTSYWVTTFQNPIYDSYGNLTHWEGVRTPSSSHPTTLTYDSLYSGLVASTTNALGQSVQQSYDAALRHSATVDQNAQSTTIYYDAYGRRTGVSPPATSAARAAEWTHVGLSPDPANICQPSPCYLITATDYSQSTRSHSVDYYRDGFGRLVATVDHVAAGDTFPADFIAYSAPSYTRDGLRLSVTEPYFAGSPPSKFIQTSLDNKGRVVSIQRMAGATVEKTLRSYAYNSDGSTSATDANGNVTRIYKNARGMVTRVNDAAGHDSYYFHDDSFANYRVLLPPVPSGTPSNPADAAIPNLSELRYTYDGFGRMTSVTDPLSHLTTYGYDDAGNLTSVSRFPSEGLAATSQLSYSYDALDRVRTEGDGSSTKTSYVYDNYQGLGPLGGSPVGRLTGVVDPSGSTFFIYNARGNVAQKFVILSGLNGLCTGAGGPPICGAFEYDFSYDDQNRLLTKTFPAFPTSNSVRSVQSFTYSKDGLLTDIAHDGVTYAHYSDFNALRQAGTKWLYQVCLFGPNDCRFANKTTYEYQAEHRVAKLRTTKAGVGPIGVGGGLSVQDDSYGYDPNGNLTSTSDNRAPSAKTYTYSTGNTAVNVDTDHGATFTYDALDRLKTWAPARLGNVGLSTYAYDALGNITSDGGDAIAYTSCGTTDVPAHCITRFAGADLFQNTSLEHFVVVPLSHGTLIPLQGDIIWSAIHDGEGKRTKLFVGVDGHTDSYAYDYKQRLIQVTRDENSAAQERYQYNYAGERTQKVFSQAGRSTTTWFIGPDFELQQSSSDPAGTYSATWYVGNAAVITGGNSIDGQASASMVVANEGKAMTGDLNRGNAQGTYLRIEDRQGSTGIMTNPLGGRAIVNGSELSRYAYDPWGQRRNGVNSSDAAHHETGYDMTPVQFTDQRYEDYSRLMFYRSRYYDPRTKRFLVADDAASGSFTAQGLNRYAYVRNNPLRYVDPSGQQAVDDEDRGDDRGDDADRPEIPMISTEMNYSPIQGDSSDVFGIGKLRCEVCEDPAFGQFTDAGGKANDGPSTHVKDEMIARLAKIERPWWSSLVEFRSEWAARTLGLELDQYGAMFPEKVQADILAASLGVAAFDAVAGSVIAGSQVPRNYRRQWSADFRRELENRQPRDTGTGQFVDLDSLELIPLGKEHVGHLGGLEHRRLQPIARTLNMSQAEFNAWVWSNPNWFILQSGKVNLSHSTEVPGSNLLLPLVPETPDPDRF